MGNGAEGKQAVDRPTPKKGQAPWAAWACQRLVPQSLAWRALRRTCDREVVQWGQGLIRGIRPLLVADEGAVTLQQEVPGPPGLDVFT